MQWPFIITAEQWSAAGTFWGGMAQVALVVVGALAGREWLRQKRFEGVRLLLEEYVMLHHEMNKSLAKLIQMTSSKTGEAFWEERDTSLIQLDTQRVQLLFLLSRSRFYDDVLADGLDNINKQILHYRQDYILYRYIPIGEAARQLNREDAAHNDAERRRLGLMLFVPESAWWQEFTRLNDVVMRQGRKLLWGK